MNPDDPWRRWAIGASLIAFCIAIYFLTYSGHAISRDEWFLFDATESMARRGNMEQNYQFDAYPPFSLKTAQPPSADAEPLQPILAAPLFLIAQALPGIGLAHTVWLFNVLVTALTVGVLYAYGLALGYRARVAALVALMFGVGTIAWPYSRTFFREPLFTLLALLSAYLMMRVRQQLIAGGRPILAGIGFAAAFAGALLSKEATLLLVPMIILEALPARVTRLRLTRREIGIYIAITVLVVILFFIIYAVVDKIYDLPNRYDPRHRTRQAWENAPGASEGIAGYLISPGRSLWVFSPVLLIGFFGWPRLAREKRWRQIAVPLAMVVTFVVGYAVVRGADRWSGGLGWGARYLVPVTPLVALWLLPVVDSLLASRAGYWKRLAVSAVFLVSAGIQLLAALVPIHRYADTLPSDIRADNADLWTLRWSPIPRYLSLLGDQDIDVAWQYATDRAWLLPALCVALAILALGSAIWWTRRTSGSRRALALTAGSLIMATAIALGGGLYAIQHDPRYGGAFPPARDLLDALDAQLRSDDVIVLNDFTYTAFFMNYYKRAKPVIYTLPFSPGERPSPEQPPEVESENPDELIHPADTIIFADLARRHDRLWLVINSSRFIPWSVRPVELYLTRHYFPVSEIAPTDTARAVLFDLTPAPPATAPAWPAQTANVAFGDSLRLAGCDIPGDVAPQPDEVLPVSLLWETLAPVPQDYTVGVFLVAADGTLAAQHDAFPANYFEHTQAWLPGSLHRDNHGLPLPAALPPGGYELWVAVYYWETPADRLPVTDADGQALGDHAVLTTITVGP